MPSSTHRRSGSKWKSGMTNGSFGCGCGTTERALTRSILNEDGRPGHYGLRGMRERAKLVGGKLAVWSELDSGTEVELSIPASRCLRDVSRCGAVLGWLRSCLGKTRR